MSNNLLEQVKKGLLDLDKETSMEAARAIAAGDESASAEDAVDAVAGALQIVGRRFQDGDWFLAELVYAGEIAKDLMGLLSPLMKAGAADSAGTVVVGTVKGDLHDLGKNIFINYATSAGFNMVDVGIDVSTQKFVDAVREHEPLALGMSCLLTSTEREIGKVIEELKASGLRDGVRVIIGGAALTQQFADEVGADAFAPDAVTGTDIVKGWTAS
jgi:5-methyltetrahydrofolate--homocysteine methyltransferase